MPQLSTEYSAKNNHSLQWYNQAISPTISPRTNQRIDPGIVLFQKRFHFQRIVSTKVI